MTRTAFINGLKNALENDLNANLVREHVNYYNDYIDNEIKNGRDEADVIAELGDPWAIAKTIITSESNDSNNYEKSPYTSTDYESRNTDFSNNSKVHVFGLDSWWKKLLAILGIIGIIMIVFSIISGLISLIAPFIVPIIVIYFVLKLFKKH